MTDIILEQQIYFGKNNIDTLETTKCAGVTKSTNGQKLCTEF